MNMRMIGIAALSTLMAAPAAFADRGWERHDIAYARVLSADPIYTTVRISEPRQECWDERVAYRDPYNDQAAAGAVIGAVAGGVAGHQFGKGRGRDAATVLGVLIGASIGQRAVVQNAPPPRFQRTAYEQRCRVVRSDAYERHIDGYDVAYRYDGVVYHTRMPYDPGRRIAVHVDVRPARY